MRLVQNQGSTALNLMPEILTVFLVRFFRNVSHDRNQSRIFYVVVDIKMLCPVNHPIKLSIRHLIFAEILCRGNRNPKTKYQAVKEICK